MYEQTKQLSKIENIGIDSGIYGNSLFDKDIISNQCKKQRWTFK